MSMKIQCQFDGFEDPKRLLSFLFIKTLSLFFALADEERSNELER
jgi:hypothetical protein